MITKFWKLISILTLSVVFICPATKNFAQNSIPKIAKGKIFVDGLSSDWNGIKPIVENTNFSNYGQYQDFNVEKLSLCYDNENLYFLITMDVGVAEYVAKTRRTGVICDIFLDTDNDINKGCVNMYIYGFGEVSGYDYKIGLPMGYSSDVNGTFFCPLVVLLIDPPNEKRTDFYSAKTITKYNSNENSDKVRFVGKNVEFVIPMKLLDIKPGIKINGILKGWGYDKKGVPFSFVIQE